jgi:hypothetical protein
LPSNALEPHAGAFDRVDAAARAFAAGGAPDPSLWAKWGTFERQRFLQTIGRELPVERCDQLEQGLSLNALGNDEVLADWLMLAVRSGYPASAAAVSRFLRGQGRAKYVVPMYRALMAQGPWGQRLARETYASARASYHPIVVSAVDSIVRPG